MLLRWILLLLLIVPPALSAQTPAAPNENHGDLLRKQVRAAAIEQGQSIHLDGVLDEPVWLDAAPVSDFIQREPSNGEPATERTEVRVVFDRGTLYLGVHCFDSEPDRISAIQKQRDQDFDGEDRFMWSLDPYFNGRTGYSFTITASGAMGDALILGLRSNNLNTAWDGIWDGRVHRDEQGWTAEIQIPFRTISFDPQAQAWGVNFQRTIGRKNEDALWSGWYRNTDLNRLVSSGELVGLQDISQGFGLDVKPHIVGRYAALGEGASARASNAEGVDFFYSLTPQLKANFTINTDFAETEVDDRQVNLTRFPLFFPERREFFLEGSTFFDFGRDGSRAVMPFFSR